jgi:hypothetical protein
MIKPVAGFQGSAVSSGLLAVNLSRIKIMSLKSYVSIAEQSFLEAATGNVH